MPRDREGGRGRNGPLLRPQSTGGGREGGIVGRKGEGRNAKRYSKGAESILFARTRKSETFLVKD